MPDTLLVWVPQSDVQNNANESKAMQAFNKIASKIIWKDIINLDPTKGGGEKVKKKKPSRSGTSPPKYHAVYWKRFLENATFDHKGGKHVGQSTVIRATTVGKYAVQVTNDNFPDLPFVRPRNLGKV